MTRPSILFLWVERTLIGVGAAFGLWCAITIMEARYYSLMPIPPPGNGTARAMLPGESSGERPQNGSAIAAGTWLARLEAPSVNLAATVLEGSGDTTLHRAAGHIEETAFPGERGNVGIAAHRDTIFRPLRNLRLGDTLTLTTADRVYRYRVATTQIVQPEDVRVLDPRDHPTLTLVTCYPFDFIGPAPQRFIVTADLVGEETTLGESGRSERSGGSGGPGGPGR